MWNEKADLLKRGMELNPFSSEHFYWIDVGCLRPANIIPQLKNLFWLKKRKIIFQTIKLSNFNRVLLGFKPNP